MPTKIQKWGNSLAVRIPKEMVNRLGLREGSEVLVVKRAKSIIIQRRFTQGKAVRKGDWRQFLVPIARKKENVSGKIDEILYDGRSR